jgi:hypothetical protein
MQQMNLYCRFCCLLNMFRAPLCPSSGVLEYYTSGCCLSYLVLGFQVVGTARKPVTQPSTPHCTDNSMLTEAVFTWGYVVRLTSRPFRLRERAMDPLSSGDHSSCRNVINAFEGKKICYSLPQWLSGLRRRSTAARLLR